MFSGYDIVYLHISMISQNFEAMFCYKHRHRGGHVKIVKLVSLQSSMYQYMFPVLVLVIELLVSFILTECAICLYIFVFYVLSFILTDLYTMQSMHWMRSPDVYRD